MHDQCTCGNHLDFDNELLRGKMMTVFHQRNGPLYRALIFFADAGDGTPPGEVVLEELYRTPWYRSAARADRDALYHYWPLYEFRHGFKHPEDPRRTSDDPPPSETVISFCDEPTGTH